MASAPPASDPPSTGSLAALAPAAVPAAGAAAGSSAVGAPAASAEGNAGPAAKKQRTEDTPAATPTHAVPALGAVPAYSPVPTTNVGARPLGLPPVMTAPGGGPEAAALREKIFQAEKKLRELYQMNQTLLVQQQMGMQQAAIMPLQGVPVAPAAAANVKPHNPDWSEHNANNQTFYYNKKSGESVWTRPDDYNPGGPLIGGDPSQGKKGPPGANLFVVRKLRRGEYDDFKATDLKDAFSTYGTVTRAEMTVDKDTGWSRGFGFVSFSNVEEADQAVEHMNGTWLAGKQLKVEKTREDVPADNTQNTMPAANGGGWFPG